MATIGLWWKRQILPGFGLTLGFTLLYLSLIVLVPLSATFVRASGLGWEAFFRAVSSPRVLASYRVTFGISLAAAALNGFLGIAVAWALVRYRFPGRKILDAMVDLPFALPTAVAGIALAAIYSPNGWFGQPIMAWTGMKVAYTELGILSLWFLSGYLLSCEPFNLSSRTWIWSSKRRRPALELPAGKQFFGWLLLSCFLRS